jgi:molybdenum cofactor cytidylyltransferase
MVLAAGSGSRFGGAKLTAPWRGGRLIDGALAAAFAAPVRRVIVVTGADPAVADAARQWATANGEETRLTLVHAADHAEGMGASLRRAIGALADDCEGVFVFLGDMPSIPPDLAAKLADAVREGALAAAPWFAGRRGHPALFARSLFPRLAQASGDEGARGLFQSLGAGLARIEADSSGVLADVDTPADLRRV